MMTDRLVVRPAVKRFAILMEVKLREMDYKGGWEECSEEYLMDRLKEEMVELMDCTNDNDKIMEAVDVANFAMMIADNTDRKLNWRPACFEECSSGKCFGDFDMIDPFTPKFKKTCLSCRHFHP